MKTKINRVLRESGINHCEDKVQCDNCGKIISDYTNFTGVKTNIGKFCRRCFDLIARGES